MVRRETLLAQKLSIERLRGLGCTFAHNPVNPPAAVIPQIIFMSTADARGRHEAAAFETRGGIVLDDEVLEISHPNRAVGADFGVDGAVPFVAAGVDVHVVERLPACAVGLHIDEGYDLHRGFADHRFALESLRQSVAVDEVGTCRGGIAAEDIHLAEVRRDGVAGINGVDLLRGHAA